MLQDMERAICNVAQISIKKMGWYVNIFDGVFKFKCGDICDRFSVCMIKNVKVVYCHCNKSFPYFNFVVYKKGLSPSKYISVSMYDRHCLYI